ncbi:hypothetical protein ACJJTC_015756 [Scirpophaga incertulas]
MKFLLLFSSWHPLPCTTNTFQCLGFLEHQLCVPSSDQAANIVRYDNDANPDGSYKYAFETDNGIAAQAEGTPRDFGGNPPVVPVVSQGSFSWTAPGGEPVSITYVADENGYQPQGAAIPTPPPVPADILRALDYLAKNAQK